MALTGEAFCPEKQTESRNFVTNLKKKANNEFSLIYMFWMWIPERLCSGFSQSI